VVESDVVRLLSRAKAHAQGGRYGSAVDDLYAALLRYLEGEQLLVLERHRTNGDYVRALGQHPDWQRLLSDCGGDVERAQFGKSSADATTFERLLIRIEPVVTRVATLMLIALTSLCQLCCNGEDDAAEGRNKHWGVLGDTSPSGLALLRVLLEEQGFEVRHRVRNAAALDEQTGMLVVYDDTSLEDEDWQALDRWVRAGHELWLAGDAEAAAHFGGQQSFMGCVPPIELTADYPGERTLTAADGSMRPLALTSISGTLTRAGPAQPIFDPEGVKTAPTGSGSQIFRLRRRGQETEGCDRPAIVVTAARARRAPH
jgi:hypothetical protein